MSMTAAESGRLGGLVTKTPPSALLKGIPKARQVAKAAATKLKDDPVRGEVHELYVAHPDQLVLLAENVMTLQSKPCAAKLPRHVVISEAAWKTCHQLYAIYFRTFDARSLPEYNYQVAMHQAAEAIGELCGN